MNLVRVYRISLKRCFTTALRTEDQYTAYPEYPEIQDLSFKEKLKRKKAAVHEEIRAVRTVEEKQIKLNMPRYYGFKSYMLSDDSSKYNSLKLIQHATRTHLIKNNSLPAYYESTKVDDIMSSLKSDIEEAILLEYDGYVKQNGYQDSGPRNFADSLVVSLNRIILNYLSKHYPHLLDTQVDHNPRIVSTWYAGGMRPPEHIKRCRRGMPWMVAYENDPTDRLMVFNGCPILTLRTKLPLQSIISSSEVESPDMEIPFWEYDPRVVGTETEHRRIINTPGFWAGDPHGFGMLSYYRKGRSVNSFGDNIEDNDTVYQQAILTSFGWLQAQANLLGFNTFNDITYPMVTQTIITNGKMWSFYSYQLNTIVFHSHFINDNPKKNICWAIEEMPLFDDIIDGKIVGLNENVIKILLKLYCNIPEVRLGVNLTPFLNSEEKIIADIKDNDKREWLEREYKFLTSNRPRHNLEYEIYNWEKIYKIDNNTRFMEKRLRPFELHQQPYKRRLDDRDPIYIPRKFRPDVPRWKGRYVKEHFP